jgi:hypothetical protein
MSSRRRIAHAMLASALAATVMALSIAPSALAAQNGNGQTITSSLKRGLDPAGQLLTIKGKGFNPAVGIYVALCVTPAQGAKPGPCGGGIDMDGSSQASAWISSNPPPYARNLTSPYGKKGSFTTRIKVSPMIGDVDCRTVSCSIVARADHLQGANRRYDVAIPVSFR